MFDLLRSLAADLNQRFHARYGERGGTLVRRATAKRDDPRLGHQHPDSLFLVLYTSRPYQDSPATARHAGGMHRAVLRVDVEGDELVVRPHSPVLKCLRSRRSCLATPNFDPARWLEGVTAEAEQVLVRKMTPSLSV